jgi:hypothetical protein
MISTKGLSSAYIHQLGPSRGALQAIWRILEQGGEHSRLLPLLATLFREVWRQGQALVDFQRALVYLCSWLQSRSSCPVSDSHLG